MIMLTVQSGSVVLSHGEVVTLPVQDFVATFECRAPCSFAYTIDDGETEYTTSAVILSLAAENEIKIRALQDCEVSYMVHKEIE